MNSSRIWRILPTRVLTMALAIWVLGSASLLLPQGPVSLPLSSSPRCDLARAGRTSVSMMAKKLVKNSLSAKAEASTTLPKGPLSEYLTSTESDEQLLCSVQISGPDAEGTYECELSPITFFKLSITPLFAMQIDRAESGDSLAVRVLKGRCRVGDKESRTITINALNELSWKAADDDQWNLDASISLELDVLQAPMNGFALKAWQLAGTKIMKSACEKNAKKLFESVAEGYKAAVANPA